MIAANNVTLRLGKRALFEDVNIKFTPEIGRVLRKRNKPGGITIPDFSYNITAL